MRFTSAIFAVLALNNLGALALPDNDFELRIREANAGISDSWDILKNLRDGPAPKRPRPEPEPYPPDANGSPPGSPQPKLRPDDLDKRSPVNGFFNGKLAGEKEA